MGNFIISKRTAERLLRDVYAYDDLALRLRASGYEKHANSISDVARLLGKIGNSLMNDLERKS